MGQRGFTLVELMIVAGAMAGLALVTMNIFKQGIKTSTDLNIRQEARELRDQFNVAVSSGSCGLINPENATSTFPVVDVTVPTVTTLGSLFTKQGQFSAGTLFGKLKIQSIKIGPPDLQSSPLLADCPLTVGAVTNGGYCELGYKAATTTPTAAPAIHTNNYAAEITVNLVKPRAAGGGILPLKFLTVLTINPTTKIITGCKSIASISSAEETCRAIGAEWTTEFTCVIPQDSTTNTAEATNDNNSNLDSTVQGNNTSLNNIIQSDSPTTYIAPTPP